MVRVKQIGLVSSHLDLSENDTPSQDHLAGDGDMEESLTPQHRAVPCQSYVRLRKRGESILGLTMDDQWNT